VSIVTPVFEPGPELHETAITVFSQSFQQWEWIIVDDGSKSGNAANTINTCVDSDERVRLVRLPSNNGLSAARNAGIATARSPYVVLLDGDDLLEPTAIEKWWWYLESSPERSFCKGYSIGFGAECYLWSNGFHDHEAFLDANQLDVTSMIRLNVFQTVGGFDESNRHGLEDWEFWLRCADRGLWGGTVPEYLNWYRRRDNETRWTNLTKEGTEAFHRSLMQRFPRLWETGFPILPNCDSVLETTSMVGKNHLLVHSPRLLLIEQALGGRAEDAWNLTFLEALKADGWQVTVVVTSGTDCDESPRFSAITPDVFIAPHFVHSTDIPVFLDYLISSRQFDIACVSRSDLGHRLVGDMATRNPTMSWFTLEGDSPKAEIPSSTPTIKDPVTRHHEALKARLLDAFDTTDLRVLQECRPNPSVMLDSESRLRIVIEALQDEQIRIDRQHVVDRASFATKIRELEVWNARERDAIDWLNAERTKLMGLLDDATSDVSERTKRIAELEAWAAEQQQAIEWLNAERTKLTALLDAAASDVSERNQRIAALEIWAEEQKHAIEWLNSEKTRLEGQ
jgi:GT2 family glycosyltransferase/uncharacterized coiled-coil protein SlyX